MLLNISIKIITELRTTFKSKTNHFVQNVYILEINNKKRSFK